MKFFSRFFADVVIQITEGKAKLLKGKLSPKILREVSLLCTDVSVQRGEIWLNAVSKVTFSSEIDAKFHQRFRNVLNG